jgi:hypothetical protein
MISYGGFFPFAFSQIEAVLLSDAYRLTPLSISVPECMMASSFWIGRAYFIFSKKWAVWFLYCCATSLL